MKPTGKQPKLDHADRLAQREAALRRRFQALELRKAGLSLANIAATLHVSASQVGRDLRQALELVHKAETLRLTHLRLLESERLDTASLAIARKVKQGDISAIDRWLKLSEARRKLLGIDQPRGGDDDEGPAGVRVIRSPLPAPGRGKRAEPEEEEG